MDNAFTLVTDSSCDLSPAYLEENGIISMQLSFTMNGETHQCGEMPPEEFYSRMRAGGMPITAQVNVGDATRFLESVLQKGGDLLYIAFSSGLSGTYNSGFQAAQELKEQYPNQKIIVVDSLCASLGQGLLVYKANELRRQGKSLEEVARWVEENHQRVIHYVVVEDLMHLHRGGRVSKTSAVIGSMLGIKPIIYLNPEGKLEVIDKMRGRKQAQRKMLEHAAGAVGDTENDICFICHSDCLEEAEYMRDLVRERFGVENFVIDFIGPVIGAHTGIGTVAIFLMGQHR